MRLRAVTLASPHSGTATIAVLQRQCQRGHPRPGSSWSYAGDIDDFPFICREHGFAGGTECPDCSYEEFGEPRFQPRIGGTISPSDSGSAPVASPDSSGAPPAVPGSAIQLRQGASLDSPPAPGAPWPAPLPPPTRPPAMDQHRRVGHRAHRWIAQAPGPTPWPGPPGPPAQSPTPPAVSSGRGSRTGEGVPPSVNYKLEMRRPLSNRWKTPGKTAGKPASNRWKTPPQNRRETTGKNCWKTAENRRGKPRFGVTFTSLNKRPEWPERASPASFFGPWGGLP